MVEDLAEIMVSSEGDTARQVEVSPSKPDLILKSQACIASAALPKHQLHGLHVALLCFALIQAVTSRFCTSFCPACHPCWSAMIAERRHHGADLTLTCLPLAPSQLALARQPLVPPPSLTNGLLNGGVPSPAAVKAAAGSLKAAAGSTKAAAATNSLYGQQVGTCTSCPASFPGCSGLTVRHDGSAGLSFWRRLLLARPASV